MLDLDCVNRALAFIGEPPATSMADTARGARRAIGVYPNCRDEVLRMVPWTCCIKRMILWDCAEQATPWTANHRYGEGERITNDTSKTYICTKAGRSNTTGGPTGTGTDIADNEATWDYVEASTAAVNWCHWVNTAYTLEDIVSWDTGKVYRCITAGTTAAATPPTGVTADITDGTAHWAYYTTIPYNRTVYAYQYVLPTDCVRVLKVPNYSLPKESDQGVQFKVEGRFLYCDQVTSSLTYVHRADPSEWDPLLQGTVAMRVAVEIAYDVTAKESVLQAAVAMLGNQYAAAKMIAMNEGQEGTPEVTPWQDV